MQIALPLNGSERAEHFGHAPQFMIIKVDAERRRIESKKILDAPPHESGVLPRWLRDHGVEVILAGGMGSRAQQHFAQSQINVVTGIRAASPPEVVEAYLNGTLRVTSNPCDH